MFKEMLSSKKFWYAVVGLIVAVVGHVKPEWGDTVQNMLYGIVALILGQGLSDVGKSAKLIENENK